MQMFYGWDDEPEAWTDKYDSTKDSFDIEISRRVILESVQRIQAECQRVTMHVDREDPFTANQYNLTVEAFQVILREARLAGRIAERTLTDILQDKPS